MVKKKENKKDGLAKIIVQVFFLALLIIIFIIDKVFSLVEPPLTDWWYLVIMLMGIGIDPILLIKIYKGQ